MEVRPTLTVVAITIPLLAIPYAFSETVFVSTFSLGLALTGAYTLVHMRLGADTTRGSWLQTGSWKAHHANMVAAVARGAGAHPRPRQGKPQVRKPPRSHAAPRPVQLHVFVRDG
ncbi:hypothetical protein T484DRAFT_1912685, partial [Baffinella frigidus]